MSKLWNYWIEVIKFSHDTLASSPLLMLALALQYSNWLWNACAKNEGGINQVYFYSQN